MTHPDIRNSADDYYAKMAAGGVVLAITLLFFFFVFSPPERAGSDFVNTWMGAQAALGGHPQPWFDTNIYNAALRQVFGADFPEHHWSYPPHLLLVTWPLGFLPYMPAYVLWTVGGFALYMAVSAGGERRAVDLLMLAAAPAVVANIISGQNGFYTAALLIGGLSQLDRRPILAGVLFGFLTMKPQLGLLLPVMLMLTGQWRCIAAAGATTLTLMGITSAIFGADVWTRFLADSVPRQTEWLTHGGGIFPSMMPTAFMNARVAGLPLDWAWALQAPMSAAAIAAVAWTYWKKRDPVLSTALFLTASILVSPYAFNYDMAVFGWALAQLRHHTGNQRMDDHFAIAVWALPAITVALGLWGVPLSSLVLVAFAARLIWRLARLEGTAQSLAGMRVSA